MAEALKAKVGRQLARDPWGNVLPVLPVTDDEMSALPEYSFSLPTGKTLGKRWRRCLDRADSIWCVGEYAQLSAEDQVKYPGEVAILWFLPSVDGGTPGNWGKA